MLLDRSRHKEDTVRKGSGAFCPPFENAIRDRSMVLPAQKPARAVAMSQRPAPAPASLTTNRHARCSGGSAQSALASALYTLVK